MIYLQEDFVTLSYLEDTNTVFADWHKRFLKYEELVKGLNKGLELIHARGATGWVANMKEVGALPAAFHPWMSDEFLPQINHTTIKRWAYITSDYVLNNIDVATIISRAANRKFEVRYFAAFEEAMEWLAGASAVLESQRQKS